MKVQTNHESTKDKLKWSTVVVFILATIAVNLFFINQGLLIRAGSTAALLVIAAGIAYTTATGSKVIEFFSEARAEVRRVVWPTREETVQATLLVMAAVVIMSIVLWGVDTLLFHLMALITA
jgi:preprotein translocase subunit SecE